MPAPTLTLTANGQTFTHPSPLTLTEFLQSRQLAPERVVVERNGQALTPGEIRTTTLADGDQLEIVRIVAGG